MTYKIFAPSRFVKTVWPRVQDFVANISVGLACTVFLLSILFAGLPRFMWGDLFREDWCWGCPFEAYVVQYDESGRSSSWEWGNVITNVLFWMFYFFVTVFVLRFAIQKIGLKIRRFYSLCVITTLTAILYAYLYRPDDMINAETGGFLRFLETQDEQIDQAMRFGEFDTMQAMLKKNPDLVFSGSATGETPLDEAAYYGQYRIAKLLLANKAKINVKDNYGETPLFGSAMNGYLGVTELLLENGAEVNVKDDQQETPLIRAAEGGDNRTVNLLLANKADVNARDNDGDTPLLEAVKHKHRSTAQLLIISNAELNVRDNQGESPLHAAAWNGDKNMIKFLLAYKVDVNAKDKNGSTPLQDALDDEISNGVVQLLRQYGATNN